MVVLPRSSTSSSFGQFQVAEFLVTAFDEFEPKTRPRRLLHPVNNGARADCVCSRMYVRINQADAPIMLRVRCSCGADQALSPLSRQIR